MKCIYKKKLFEIAFLLLKTRLLCSMKKFCMQNLNFQKYNVVQADFVLQKSENLKQVFFV